SHRSVVIDHKAPTLSGGEPRTSTILSVALRNLDNFFNTRFEITGGTAEDYRRIEAVVPIQRVLPEDFMWHTHVRSDSAGLSQSNDIPVIRINSYGNLYLCPNNDEVFKELYG